MITLEQWAEQTEWDENDLPDGHRLVLNVGTDEPRVIGSWYFNHDLYRKVVKAKRLAQHDEAIAERSRQAQRRISW